MSTVPKLTPLEKIKINILLSHPISNEQLLCRKKKKGKPYNLHPIIISWRHMK